MVSQDFRQVVWDASTEAACRQLVRWSLDEDLNGGLDLTTEALVAPGRHGAAQVVAREAGIVAGLPSIPLVLEALSSGAAVSLQTSDGQPIAAGEVLARLSGPAGQLLTAERTLLNLVGRLSGIATLTRTYVDRVASLGARIYDTRKTTPGWRLLEKYAVGCGGGSNHRLGLFDAVLIKDNHLALSPEKEAEDALRKARSFLAARPPQAGGPPLIEIEVDDLQQLERVLGQHPDLVLLDNMTLGMLRDAVSLRNQRAPDIELEASGGVSLETVADIARTGVDRISVGRLTHGAASLDVGLDWLA